MTRERPDGRLTMMYQDPNAYFLASLLLEDNGSVALHDARKVAENLSDANGEASGADFVQIVRAMDLLLTDDGTGTIH